MTDYGIRQFIKATFIFTFNNNAYMVHTNEMQFYVFKSYACQYVEECLDFVQKIHLKTFEL